MADAQGKKLKQLVEESAKAKEKLNGLLKPFKEQAQAAAKVEREREVEGEEEVVKLKRIRSARRNVMQSTETDNGVRTARKLYRRLSRRRNKLAKAQQRSQKVEEAS